MFFKIFDHLPVQTIFSGTVYLSAFTVRYCLNRPVAPDACIKQEEWHTYTIIK